MNQLDAQIRKAIFQFHNGDHVINIKGEELGQDAIDATAHVVRSVLSGILDRIEEAASGAEMLQASQDNTGTVAKIRRLRHEYEID